MAHPPAARPGPGASRALGVLAALAALGAAAWLAAGALVPGPIAVRVTPGGAWLTLEGRNRARAAVEVDGAALVLARGEPTWVRWGAPGDHLLATADGHPWRVDGEAPPARTSELMGRSLLRIEDPAAELLERLSWDPLPGADGKLALHLPEDRPAPREVRLDTFVLDARPAPVRPALEWSAAAPHRIAVAAPEALRWHSPILACWGPDTAGAGCIDLGIPAGRVFRTDAVDFGPATTSQPDLWQDYRLGRAADGSFAVDLAPGLVRGFRFAGSSIEPSLSTTPGSRIWHRCPLAPGVEVASDRFGDQLVIRQAGEARTLLPPAGIQGNAYLPDPARGSPYAGLFAVRDDIVALGESLVVPWVGAEGTVLAAYPPGQRDPAWVLELITPFPVVATPAGASLGILIDGRFREIAPPPIGGPDRPRARLPLDMIDERAPPDLRIPLQDQRGGRHALGWAFSGEDPPRAHLLVWTRYGKDGAELGRKVLFERPRDPDREWEAIDGGETTRVDPGLPEGPPQVSADFGAPLALARLAGRDEVLVAFLNGGRDLEALLVDFGTGAVLRHTPLPGAGARGAFEAPPLVELVDLAGETRAVWIHALGGADLAYWVLPRRRR